MARTLYKNISELITNQGVEKKRGVGIQHDDLGIITDGALVWDSSKGIAWMGKTSEIPKKYTRLKKVNLKGKILSPALVDSHTHMVFAGSRHNEFARRLEGATYQEIAVSGGGIVASVRFTRSASEADLFKQAKDHVQNAYKLGAGIIEIKSGYGLDWPTEKKMLQVISKLKKHFKNKILIQSTFLGAHAFPPEFRENRNGYVRYVVEKMIPEVKRLKLADCCDVFFDEGYFDEQQSREVLNTAKKAGLKIKLHADELADTGGAALAAELGALSADHLLCANEGNLKKMADAGVVATLLPGTAMYLNLPYAPVDKMRKAGVCMALASDFNPGSSPILSMPFIMSLACLQMGMTMAESFSAATYGGARALGFHKNQGFLKVGNKPKMAIFNCESYQALIGLVAHPGLCAKVI